MKVTVIGAGTMGNGIAHVFAQYGHNVILFDIQEEQLENARHTIEKNLQRQVTKDKLTSEEARNALNAIEFSHDLKYAAREAELVIEAATENEKVKLDIFSELGEICAPQTILATNTSSISITKIAQVTGRPEKVIGMHFMNPVPVMKLVEVIKGYSTADEVTQTILEISKSIGKIPVEVNDYPGFIANRILMPMLNEAIYALHEGVAGVSEIDQIMKLGMAHPMGPLELADFIGLDVCHSILRVLHDGLGLPKYFPCPLLTNMVLSGNLGRKTGEGFYSYSGGSKEYYVAPKFTNQ